MTISSEEDDDRLVGPLTEEASSLTKSSRALKTGPEADLPSDEEPVQPNLRPGSDSGNDNPVWIVIELSEEDLDSAFADRVTRAGFKSQPHHPSIFLRRSEVDPGALAHMMDNLVGRTTQKAGAASAKMTVLTGLGEPSLTEILTQLEPLQQFLARLKAQWLMPFIVARRVVSAFQPVLRVDGSRFGHDALVRVFSEHSSTSATDIMLAAAQLDLSSLVDRLARVDAFTRLSEEEREESSTERNANARLILHASAATLNSPAAMTSSLVELGRLHGVALDRLIVNAPWASCGESVLVARSFYELKRLGVQVSVGGGPPHPDFMTSNAIADLAIELDANIVRVPADGDGGFAPELLVDLCNASVGRAFQVHATRIESAGAALAAKRAGAALISGFLF